MGEAGLAEYLHHLLALRKRLYCPVEVLVCALVLGDEPGIADQQGVGINVEKLFHREADRCRQLHDAQMSAFLQHTADFGESFVKVLEIADAERRRDCIESLVRKGKAEAILFPERDNPVESGRLHLLAADGHHAFRDVRTDKMPGFQFPGGENGEVAGSRSDVEHLFRTERQQLADGLLPPSLVNIP